MRVKIKKKEPGIWKMRVNLEKNKGILEKESLQGGKFLEKQS